ncbi:MAG: triose-phosphate isomerase [Chloroflexota bacterium]|nr:triose-phosphate isomerase [Chloroflexota bacterium]
MTRTPLIAGNWKMNLLRDDAIALARAVRERGDAVAGVETLVCPPYVFLHDVRRALEGSRILLGAQDFYWEEKGAFTGEVSVTQVAEAASYAIIGHSERRQYFGETDETVNRKVRAALAHGLQPIMCVGETLDQRQGGETAEVLVRQVRGGLDGIDAGPRFVVAYEPVWAIGTGLAADAATAQEAIALIRRTLRELRGGTADAVRILYGGSVTPENTAELLAQPDIDGGLVGGASLKADAFSAIIEAAAAVSARA